MQLADFVRTRRVWRPQSKFSATQTKQVLAEMVAGGG